MIISKIIFHFGSFLKCLYYKIVYGSSFSVGKRVTWRKRFDLMIDKKASVSIGDNCFFNNDCSINALGSIDIGSGSIFGEGVKIYDHNHRFNEFDTPLKYQGYTIGCVRIGNNCWIGSNVVILKGASIGDNCVISAGTVISSVVPEKTIVRNGEALVFESIRRKSNAPGVSNNGCI